MSGRRLALQGMQLVGWIFLLVGLVVIALNPGVPSLGFALFWLGVMTAARAASFLVPWIALVIDLSLLLVCVVGLETGGLILVPSVVAFAVADALPREWAHAS